LNPGAPPYNLVYVAFDAEFADNGLIYYATSASTVGKATVDGTDLDDVLPLTDDQSPAGTATATSFSGIAVASDNALYAIGGDVTVTPPTTITAISGDIVLTGDTSLNTGTATLANVQVTVLMGPFTDGENVQIGDPDNDLSATGYNTVEGIIYVADEDVTPDSAAYTAVISIPVTLDDASQPFDIGENVTVSEAVADNLVIDTNYVTDAGGTVYGETNLFRLLLHEDDNAWETARLDGAMDLWLSEGTNNVLWTMAPPVTEVVTPTVWALEDTLSGPVTGVAVSGIGEEVATVEWDAMTGANNYEYQYDSTSGTTTSTSKKLSGLDDNTDYDVKVRVAIGGPWSSRWSDEASFTTLEAIMEPENQVPDNGMQDAPLLPSFVWKTVPNAASYEFQLSTDPAFATKIVDTTIMAPVTAYTCTTELAYDTNHYWRVRAVSATGTKSTWCFSNFHTMLEPVEPPPPVTIVPPPTPTIVLPAPEVTVVPPDVQVTVVPPDIVVDVPPPVEVVVTQVPAPQLVTVTEEITPIYIWIIVAIGAVLTLAVIVLIIRTRRVV
jgi:hypothetical protein